MATTRHRTYNVLGNLLRFLAYPEETEGKYCVVEAVVPKGVGAPPNSHKGEMESFYVLEGGVGFMVDGQEMVGRAGDFFVIPDGAVHAFSGIAERSRMLITNAPGVIHDKFFTGIGAELPEDATDAPPPDGPPDVPALIAKAAELGITIHVPEGASAWTGKLLPRT